MATAEYSTPLAEHPQPGAGSERFQRITSAWDLPEDDFTGISMLFMLGLWFFPIFPILMAVMMPFWAFQRLKIVRRMTLLDFMIFWAAIGNFWGLSVKEIGWHTDGRLVLLVFLTLECVSYAVVASAWAIRTAESLEQKNLARAVTLFVSILFLPSVFWGFYALAFAKPVPGSADWMVLRPVLAVLVPALTAVAVCRLHVLAQRARTRATGAYHQRMAAKRIAERRRFREARVQRRKKKRKKRPATVGQQPV